MGAQLRALAIVVMLLGLIGGLPGMTAPASAEPTDVTVATHDLAPFVMTNNNVKSGFDIDILNEIAIRMQWSVTYDDIDDVTDQLKEVAEGRADAAMGAISITSARSKVFDFSQPVANGGLRIMVPQSAAGRSLPGIVEFAELLFSRAMLVWLAAALVIALIPAHITWLVERRHDDSMVAKAYFPGVFQALGWSLGMLATQPDEFPRHWASRGIGLVLAFISIIFVAIFTATLTANITVSKFDSQISSPADLPGKRVCTVADTTSAIYLNNLGVTFTGVKSIDDCFKELRNQNLDAVVFDGPVLSYFVAQDDSGMGQIVGPIFEREDYGVAFRRGSELRRQFDEALLGMKEDGSYDLIKQKWFGDDGTSTAGG